MNIRLKLHLPYHPLPLARCSDTWVINLSFIYLIMINWGFIEDLQKPVSAQCPSSLTRYAVYKYFVRRLKIFHTWHSFWPQVIWRTGCCRRRRWSCGSTTPTPPPSTSTCCACCRWTSSTCPSTSSPCSASAASSRNVLLSGGLIGNIFFGSLTTLLESESENQAVVNHHTFILHITS